MLGERKPTPPHQPHQVITCLSLRGTAVLGAEDIFNEPFPDLPGHALSLLDRLLDLVCYLCSHTLEVNVIAFRHISHRRRRVNMRAIGGGSVDGRLHDLLDQSKARILSSGQKYRLFSLSSGSLCC